MDITTTLANMKEADQRKFLTIRTNMRKTYLMAIAATVGIANYASEDDSFMDSLDIKCEMLATRAGMSTINNDNLHADDNATDMFAIITRPAAKADNITAINAATNVPTNNWAADKEKVA